MELVTRATPHRVIWRAIWRGRAARLAARRAAVAAGALVFALAIAAACGGGGIDTPVVLDEVPTATPPAVLPDVLIVGQTELPVSSATYVVVDGDSLSAIADRFGTTVDEIVAANDLEDAAVLFVGQELVIPGVDPGDDIAEPTEEPLPTDEPPATEEPLPTDTPVPVEPEETPTPFDGETYTVQEGDIPNTIAEQFGISAEALMEANGITDPTSLQIGQVLIIPSPSPDVEP